MPSRRLWTGVKFPEPGAAHASFHLGVHAPDGGAGPPAELVARMAVKTRSAGQLYDSLGRVGLRPAAEGQDRLADPRRQAFLIKLLTQTRTVTDFELGVPQALTLMNGAELVAVTDPQQSGLLKALEAPFLDDSQRIETAFLATLGRRPRERERSTFVAYINSRPAHQSPQPHGAVVWALVYSAAFLRTPPPAWPTCSPARSSSEAGSSGPHATAPGRRRLSARRAVTRRVQRRHTPPATFPKK